MNLRYLILIFAIILTFPAFAQSGATYHNKRFGFEARIPAGFQVMGVESPEGATFRGSGGTNITVFAVPLNGGFENTVQYWIDRAETYDGFAITGQTVTPDWATYQGNIGGRQTRVRMILSCGRSHAFAARVDFNGSSSNADRVLRSLKTGAC